MVVMKIFCNFCLLFFVNILFVKCLVELEFECMFLWRFVFLRFGMVICVL